MKRLTRRRFIAVEIQVHGYKAYELAQFEREVQRLRSLPFAEHLTDAQIRRLAGAPHQPEIRL